MDELQQALFDAIRADDLEAVKRCIKQGVDVNAIERHGWTPLHLAACSNHNMKILQYLISQGSDVNAKDSDGATPLHVTSRLYPNAKALKYLVSLGANVNAQDNDGCTPLHLLAESVSYWCENWDCIIHLIEHGADVDIKDNHGETAISLSPLAFILAFGFEREFDNAQNGASDDLRETTLKVLPSKSLLKRTKETLQSTQKRSNIGNENKVKESIRYIYSSYVGLCCNEGILSDGLQNLWVNFSNTSIRDELSVFLAELFDAKEDTSLIISFMSDLAKFYPSICKNKILELSEKISSLSAYEGLFLAEGLKTIDQSRLPNVVRQIFESQKQRLYTYPPGVDKALLYDVVRIIQDIDQNTELFNLEQEILSFIQVAYEQK